MIPARNLLRGLCAAPRTFGAFAALRADAGGHFVSEIRGERLRLWEPAGADWRTREWIVATNPLEIARLPEGALVALGPAAAEDPTREAVVFNSEGGVRAMFECASMPFDVVADERGGFFLIDRMANRLERRDARGQLDWTGEEAGLEAVAMACVAPDGTCWLGAWEGEHWALLAMDGEKITRRVDLPEAPYDFLACDGRAALTHFITEDDDPDAELEHFLGTIDLVSGAVGIRRLPWGDLPLDEDGLFPEPGRFAASGSGLYAWLGEELLRAPLA